jgi:hypothetical protein
MGKRERWESGSCAREKLNRGERDTGGGAWGGAAAPGSCGLGSDRAGLGQAGPGGAGLGRVAGQNLTTCTTMNHNQIARRNPKRD